MTDARKTPHPGMEAFDHPPGSDDTLAFLRQVAEQGRATATLSGFHLALWGVAIAGAYLNHYAVIAGLYGAGWTIGAGYVAMAAVGWPVSMVVGYHQGAEGAMPHGAKVYATVFATAGLALSVFAVGASLTPAAPGQLTMIVAALMTGLCFVATGALAKMGWLLAVGAAWMLAAAGFFALIEDARLLLAGAGVWGGLMAGPGFWLMAANARRAAPRAEGAR